MVIGIDASRATRIRKTGTEWYSHHLIKNLVEVDSDNTYVLYTDRNAPFDPPFTLGAHVRQKNLFWPLPFLWTQGRLSLEMMIAPPDVLFVPSHALPVVTGGRTVTTIHDVGFRQWKHLINPADAAYLEWSTRFAVKQATALITISEFTKGELVRLFDADGTRVHVIPLGYDSDLYRPLIDDDYVSLLLDRCKISRPFLLSVGRIDGRKNILVLMRAFERMKNSHPELSLVLVGPTGSGGEQILRALSSSRYADSIHVRGWISEEEKVGLLNACECLVFPTLYEGFGLPVLEAQACGAPVVCSGLTALPEVAGEGALYFEPHSISDIAETVGRVLSDRVLRERLKAKGFENVKRYSWKKTAIKTRDVLLGL